VFVTNNLLQLCLHCDFQRKSVMISNKFQKFSSEQGRDPYTFATITSLKKMGRIGLKTPGPSCLTTAQQSYQFTSIWKHKTHIPFQYVL